VVSIRTGEYEWVVTVMALTDRRGPAEVARTLYDESEESRARRAAQAAGRRAERALWGERKGRPTKRERRDLQRWKSGDEGH
jgi:ribosome-associated heat shock protein Hsp15